MQSLKQSPAKLPNHLTRLTVQFRQVCREWQTVRWGHKTEYFTSGKSTYNKTAISWKFIDETLNLCHVGLSPDFCSLFTSTCQSQECNKCSFWVLDFLVFVMCNIQIQATICGHVDSILVSHTLCMQSNFQRAIWNNCLRGGLKNCSNVFTAFFHKQGLCDLDLFSR